MQYPFADVGVVSSENASDKKSIVDTYHLKEGFLWGIYKKKGLGLLQAYQKERSNRIRIKTTVRCVVVVT